MSNSAIFKPIFATSEKISSSSINNGSFYVATDNGEAYLDIQGNRVKLINTLYDKLSGITSVSDSINSIPYLSSISGSGAIGVTSKGSGRTQTISLSAATSTMVGGVKSGTDISVDGSGNVTVLSAGQVKHDLKFNFTGDTSASTFNGSTDINIYAGLGISFNMGSESDECYIGINKANNSQSYLYVNNSGIGVSGITEAITGSISDAISGLISINYHPNPYDETDNGLGFAKDSYDETNGKGILVTYNPYTQSISDTTYTIGANTFSLDLSYNGGGIINAVEIGPGAFVNYIATEAGVIDYVKRFVSAYDEINISSKIVPIENKLSGIDTTITGYVEDSLSAFEDNLLLSYIGEGFSPTSTIADRLNSTEAKLDGLIKVITFTSEDQTELEDYQVLWSGTTVLGGRVVGSLYDENNHQVLVGIDYVDVNTVSINLSGQTLTSQTPYTLILNAGEGGVGNSTDGGFVSAKEMEIVPLTNLEFTPKANKVYTYSVTDGDVIAFSTISNNIFSFRLYLTLPNHLITFNLPSNIIWDTPPNFSQINSLYMFVFEWNPILQKWLGNQLWKPVSIE